MDRHRRLLKRPYLGSSPGAKSQVIQWEDSDPEADNEEPPSPRMTVSETKSPVHLSQLTIPPAEKRRRTSRALDFEEEANKSQDDLFDDDNNDSSLIVSADTSKFDEAVAQPRPKGSEWVKAVDGSPNAIHNLSDELPSGSCNTGENADDAVVSVAVSSAKKRKKKFGLALKLETVLKQHRSDLALKEHLEGEGGGDDEEMFLVVNRLIREVFWTRARCTTMDGNGDEVDAILQDCHLGEDVVRNLQKGCEIKLKGPFHRGQEPCGSSDKVRTTIFGVKNLVVIDQPLKRTKRSRTKKVLKTWDWDSCESSP